MVKAFHECDHARAPAPINYESIELDSYIYVVISTM